MRTTINVRHNKNDTYTIEVEREIERLDLNPPAAGRVHVSNHQPTATFYWLAGYINGLTACGHQDATTMARAMTECARAHANHTSSDPASLTLQTRA